MVLRDGVFQVFAEDYAPAVDVWEASVRAAIHEFGAVELDVNEQNPQAIGFYARMGFDVVGRSERDGTGKPYPILHMQLRRDLL